MKRKQKNEKLQLMNTWAQVFPHLVFLAQVQAFKLVTPFSAIAMVRSSLLKTNRTSSFNFQVSLNCRDLESGQELRQKYQFSVMSPEPLNMQKIFTKQSFRVQRVQSLQSVQYFGN